MMDKNPEKHSKPTRLYRKQQNTATSDERENTKIFE